VSPNDPVVTVTQSSLRKERKRRGRRGRRRRWYDRSVVNWTGRVRPSRRVQTKIIEDQDLVRNNGSRYDEREGQMGVVVAVDHERKTASVVCPDGIVDWDFLEIDRWIVGK